MMEPFSRDPSEPYSIEAEIEAFFMDRDEWGRINLRLRKIANGELQEERDA